MALADLMVWVLDPQKYADAAVHRRYLVPMAGHSSVIAVVLNQADLLTPEQAEDCVADLRRLLELEGLHDARSLVTSAVTGAGLDKLRKVLVRDGVRPAGERGADLRRRGRVGGPVRCPTPAADGDAGDEPAGEGETVRA